MKNVGKLALALASASLLTINAEARNNPNEKKTTNKSGVNPSLVANCSPATFASELSINNTRALIQSGGDMWWDLIGRAQYEIPKGTGRTALFAGALWMGGQDVSGQLKVAAQRFRSNGNDFWTGPLSTKTAEIDPATCAEYDEQFVTTRDEVAQFAAWFEAGLFDAENGTTTQSDEFPSYSIPNSILTWPAHGRPEDPYNEDFYLAPFFDRNGDGVYNPNDGDYPAYDLAGDADCSQKINNIYGDQNLWWVFNDKGNVHTESGSAAIGMEIRAQAFAFATNDEVNNMTFYNYELHNRSTFTLTETYFGQWVDADLGNPQDDYVGCDVARGLGYCYNGDEDDEDNQGALGYGTQPPAVGVDFFQGPFQDPDGVDNGLFNNVADALNNLGIVYSGTGVGYGDGIPDNERLGMRAFLYHNNDNSNTGDPNTGVQYYNYLRGFWKDNTRMLYGGTGYVGDPAADKDVPANYMFPGDTDPLGWGTGGTIMPDWTEENSGNTPFDRRFIQSAGPFTLAPGAVNNITVGVVWARASAGGASASVATLQIADEKTQAMFDNCFKVLNGPDAPDIEVQELENEVILYLSNRTVSNNAGENYAEVDPFIVAPDSLEVNGVMTALTAQEKIDYATYRFQGYMIYQLKNEGVSPADLDDPDLARLVAQCDVKDGVSKIINYYFDTDLNGNVPVLEVDGENEGIRHSFKITEDQFATGTKTLVNHKTYYFMAIAYAYNNFKEYDPLDPEKLDGQTRSYLASRKAATGGIKVYSAIPHKTDIESNGLIVNAQYGDGVELTRIEGAGNGANFLKLKQESIDEIMAGEPWRSRNPTYQEGYGPVEVKVIDPLSVKPGTYTIKFIDIDSTQNVSDSYFEISGGDLESPIMSSKGIKIRSEELVLELGISVTTEQCGNPGFDQEPNNGFLGAEIEFADPLNPWLTGLPDQDGLSPANWILAGKSTDDENPQFNDYRIGSNESLRWLDEFEVYEDVLGGWIAPFRLVAFADHAPMSKQFNINDVYRLIGIDSTIQHLNSVDIIITNDKSKWSRVPVLEMQDTVGLSVGGVAKNLMRAAQSVDKDGNPAPVGSGASTNPEDPNYISETGMGWFPGYAIDVETGERLNMAFGEDSWLQNENGADMLWNPTSNVTEGPWEDIRAGGKHYFYVFRNMLVEENPQGVPATLQFFEDPKNRMPSYDAGQFLANQLKLGATENIRNVYRSCSWVGLPLVNPAYEFMSSDVTIRLRVAKPYTTYGTQDYISAGESLEAGETYWVNAGPIIHNGITYERGDYFTAVDNAFAITTTDNKNNLVKTVNNAFPMYSFSLDSLAVETGNATVFEDALADINVVPNPYYAYSLYEDSKLDNRIKIINLPQTCTVTIYTVDGNLIRQFQKDDPTITSIDWDLKNFADINIAGGVYLIHVDVPGVGERVLKWFGVLRPIDLDSF